jgi:hypothetical protein
VTLLSSVQLFQPAAKRPRVLDGSDVGVVGTVAVDAAADYISAL